MSDYKVKITVDDKGNFTYDPSFIRVTYEDRITFTLTNSSHQHFEVIFKERTPGDKLYLWEGDRTLKIEQDAPYGLYHYAAAVFTGSRVFMDSGCGDVGVQSSP